MANSNTLIADGGSFRDPASKVYVVNDNHGNKRILRGLNEQATTNLQQLSTMAFYKRLLEEKRLVTSSFLEPSDKHAKAIQKQGWFSVVEHQTIPLISYCYEWTFGMLKTAALLHLRLMEDAINEGWILKDASPYNIQFEGPRPIFIDIPSFEPWQEGEPWIAYRQFCSCFLIPLLIHKHLGISHQPILRSMLDGIAPSEAVKYFKGTSRFKKGVMSHIILPAYVENRIHNKERDVAASKERINRQQSKTMLLALVVSLRRLITSLNLKSTHSAWSHYDQNNSYMQDEHEEKKQFVENVAAQTKRNIVWDIGSNTGTFSRILSPTSNLVVSLDGDQEALEKLYQSERKKEASNIQPMVMDLSNISPNQGWNGKERSAFDQREKPDLILALALIHHIRISAHVPIPLFLDWLRDLSADVVIEFVDRHDEMVEKLLTNKTENYPDYNRESFISEAKKRFSIKDQLELKGGKRVIFHLTPA